MAIFAFLTEFNLPNATTWFYFSLLLVIALFFKFTRLLSMRNWDLLALFLLAPGFLLIQDASHLKASIYSTPRTPEEIAAIKSTVQSLTIYGYVWLISASGYWLIRCIVDLAMIRRPALSTNLNFSGLAWLAIALFAFLTVVAFRPNRDEFGPVGRGPIALQQVEEGAAKLVSTSQLVSEPQDPESQRNIRFWVSRSVSMTCHLAILVGLVMIGWRHFGDPTTGMAMAAMHVLLPYTAFMVGQVHHILPAALILWAVFTFRHPGLSGLLLGVAAGSSFFPLLLFPLWCGFFWNRGATRFSCMFVLAAVMSLSMTGVVLWWQGQLQQVIQELWLQHDWQPWKIPQNESIWTGVHWAYRMPVFIAFLAMWIVGTFWPAPKNLAQLVAQTAVILLGIQFWYTDQGGRYVLWYLPLLTVLVFRPNLAEMRPSLATSERDWMVRWRKAITSRIRGTEPSVSTVEVRQTAIRTPVKSNSGVQKSWSESTSG
ncbi:hypothetical protein [Tuwongella immobilis]|uniref:Uncharacterized protein n=1 Tax=Tuwongella immobilis TaxID=692036 RepID=A0A6C2YP31_9BACT|nr:hypothetical protein [Tuwongella immobilis]VIP03380.1 Uncharacterized protein OS=Planctomyces limnophilus (strain ATCC 43296 / DSM 3776 / IFAM 1008 / 290) GN=Plim_0529 PE=4 SV=1 [Tuwongella immobilis]VTS04132.1 Uncharacterized protein OS=Planctomyces limnophilus (strain ATCC 43296 / DSM 3776 / IFAM 1008 / 290) GN=Plim_0529 PE=4 SV=1 [Tuwongella immobilis]